MSAFLFNLFIPPFLHPPPLCTGASDYLADMEQRLAAFDRLIAAPPLDPNVFLCPLVWKNHHDGRFRKCYIAWSETHALLGDQSRHTRKKGETLQGNVEKYSWWDLVGGVECAAFFYFECVACTEPNFTLSILRFIQENYALSGSVEDQAVVECGVRWTERKAEWPILFRLQTSRRISV